MKGIFDFLLPFLGLVAYGVGAIAGILMSFIGGYWLIGACVIALAAMAFPVAKKFYNELVNIKEEKPEAKE